MSFLDLKPHFRSIIDKEVQPYTDPTERGHVFLKWALKNIFEKAEDEYLFTDAPYDLGVDSYFEEENEVYVFQSKYGSSHSLDAITQFNRDFEILKQADISFI